MPGHLCHCVGPPCVYTAVIDPAGQGTSSKHANGEGGGPKPKDSKPDVTQAAPSLRETDIDMVITVGGTQLSF